MSEGALDDAAQMAMAIRDELVRWPGVESGSRQTGTPEHSVIDIRADDGRVFIITVEGVPKAEFEGDEEL